MTGPPRTQAGFTLFQCEVAAQQALEGKKVGIMVSTKEQRTDIRRLVRAECDKIGAPRNNVKVILSGRGK